MTAVLLLAAGYNIVWGAVVGLLPGPTLDLLGLDGSDAGQRNLWACIGMIVGVYGIGYAVAARDPLRHWPITLVGLLGKVLGPVGFAVGYFRGEVPGTLGWTILTNDLIWWVPFTMILWSAFRASQGSDHPLAPADETELADLLERTQTRDGDSIGACSRRGPVLLILLRHFGCTFCRRELADLAARRDQLAAEGVTPIVVHQSSPQRGDEVLASYGLNGVAHVSDPDKQLYRALGLRRGRLGQLLGPRVWRRGAKAFFAGHGIGKLEGDGFQMPGTFRIEHGRVTAAFTPSSPADAPDLAALACAASAAEGVTGQTLDVGSERPAA
jgi:peroxiredoxin